MVEDGSERENGRLSTMDSIESRSVFQDEDKSEIEDEEDDEDLTPRIGMDSNDDDNSEQRLIWQALGSIPLMSKHLRSPKHNGTTLRQLKMIPNTGKCHSQGSSFKERRVGN
ncbi:unnamed protein product [Camellia sinensis]